MRTAGLSRVRSASGHSPPPPPHAGRGRSPAPLRTPGNWPNGTSWPRSGACGRASGVSAGASVPVGERRGRLRGYPTRAERFGKQRRLQVLEHRLAVVESRLEAARVSVCRGGKALPRTRHHLRRASLRRSGRSAGRPGGCSSPQTAKLARLGATETIPLHPDEGWVEVKLPAKLASLANRPHSRYRLSCPDPVPRNSGGAEVAAQAASGALRYDISFDPEATPAPSTWSWTPARSPARSPGELRAAPVLAVDLNAGHMAALAVDPSGVPLVHRGPSTSTWPGYRPPPATAACGPRLPRSSISHDARAAGLS